MSHEQDPSTNGVEKLRSAEKLPPGHKLILAGPAFLLALSISPEDKLGTFFRKPSQLNGNLLQEIMSEYDSIFQLFSRIVGPENLIVAKNAITVGKDSPAGIALKDIELPPELDYGGVDLGFLTKPYSCWPRDAFSLLNGRIIGNKNAWNDHDYPTAIGLLGEGGKVLSKKDAILVTPDIWKTQKKILKMFKQEGINVGVLPFVETAKQKYDFKEDHIDGHANLLEDKNGELVLLVTDSYSKQGGSTRKNLRRTAEMIGAKLVEVEDTNLPPLPLNFLQFEDRSIAVSNSQAQDLIITLSYLVGQDKVFRTDVPLRTIPKLAGGGIRCLTNIIPPMQNLNQYLNTKIAS